MNVGTDGDFSTARARALSLAAFSVAGSISGAHVEAMEMVTVARHFNAAQADLAAAWLESAGFDVLRHSEHSGIVEGFPATVGGIRIQVPADQAEDARALLASSGEGAAETP